MSFGRPRRSEETFLADIWRHSCRLSLRVVGLLLSPMHIQVRSEGLFGGLWRLLGASLSGASAGKDVKSSCEPVPSPRSLPARFCDFISLSLPIECFLPSNSRAE